MPESARRKAFEYVVDYLKRDDDLKGLRPLWLVRDGTSQGDDPLPEGRTGIGLTPELGEWLPIGTRNRDRVYEATVRAAVEIRTPHDTWGEAADVWERIVDRLTGRGLDPEGRRDHWRRLNAAGVFDVEPTTEPAGGAPGVLTITVHTEG